MKIRRKKEKEKERERERSLVREFNSSNVTKHTI
jgi:hypothetical protein